MKKAKNMLINSVKLVNNGLKGIEVKYSLSEDKNSRSFIDEHISKKRAPIHSELDNLFVSLKPYLLDICDYDRKNIEKDLFETEVIGVTYNDKGFVITGKKCILQGDKTINLVTPLINIEDYSEFLKVTAIMDKIYDEVRLYMAGEKTLSDEQLVIKFNENKEDFDKDAFFKLSKKEQREMATKALEEMGAIILHEDEFTTEEEVEIGSNEDGDPIEIATPINKNGEKGKPYIRDNEKKTLNKEEEDLGGMKIVKDGDDFKVMASPMKQSTAKKVA